MKPLRWLALCLLAYGLVGLGGWCVWWRGGRLGPHRPAPIIRPGTEAAIDRATCEALIVAEVLRERMRLTGRLNPPAFLDPAPAPQHRDRGGAP